MTMCANNGESDLVGGEKIIPPPCLRTGHRGLKGLVGVNVEKGGKSISDRQKEQEGPVMELGVLEVDSE